MYFLFIYSVYYGAGELTADAGKFMAESKMLQEVFFQSKSAYFKFLFGIGDSPELMHQYLAETTHWDPGTQNVISDNRNILRIHSLIHFISFGYSSIHMIIMCFLSLIGIKQLFLTFNKFSKVKPLILFAAITLLPSLLFWGSSILKEPIMFVGFALILRGLLDDLAIRKRSFVLLCGVILLIGFKSYVILAIVPVLLFAVCSALLPKWKIIGSVTILVVLIFSGLMLFPDQRDEVVSRLNRKQYDFISVAKGGIHAYADTCFYFFEAEQFDDLIIDGDSVQVKNDLVASTLQLGDVKEPGVVHLEASDKKWLIYFMNEQCYGFLDLKPINNSFVQLIKNAPQALMNSLIRPFPNDSGRWLKIPAMLEIWIIWLMLILAVIKRKRINLKERRIIMGGVIFILTLALVIGWVTPVLGAIVRYRIPILIIFLLIIAILYDPPLKLKKSE